MRPFQHRVWAAAIAAAKAKRENTETRKKRKGREKRKRLITEARVVRGLTDAPAEWASVHRQECLCYQEPKCVCIAKSGHGVACPYGGMNGQMALASEHR
jgi:hypothetical protein